MHNELFPYYNDQLRFLRKLGVQFSKMHPNLAGRLQVQPEVMPDPHVELLIDALAFLNARVHFNLDQGAPDLTAAMLEVLYPHAQRPIPSMTIVRFALDDVDNKATEHVPAGRYLETELIDGNPIRFRTCYPVTVRPLSIRKASLGPAFDAPVTQFSERARGAIHIKLARTRPDLSLENAGIDRLRVFLHGQSQYTYGLYELLLNDNLGIALAKPGEEQAATVLDKAEIQPVGFEPDDAALPYPARSFAGFRLISEYFAMPEKFLFVDLVFEEGTFQGCDQSADLYIYLKRIDPELERNVTAESFQLGCTPAINLFPCRSETALLSQTEPQFRIIPQARTPLALEVYSIDAVTELRADGSEVKVPPLYFSNHEQQQAEAKPLSQWYSTRRPMPPELSRRDHGTEVYLTLIDSDFDRTTELNRSIDVELTCCNRDLPHRLPFGGGQPRLSFVAQTHDLKVTCLTRPTATLRPTLGIAAFGRLMTHLKFNQLSLVEDAGDAEMLRSLLSLYDYADSAQTRNLIRGVTGAQSRPILEPRRHGVARSVSRGREVTLELDEKPFRGSGAYLMAALLQKVLSLSCSINGFCRVIARTKQREQILTRWPATAGNTTLVTPTNGEFGKS